MTTLSSLMGGGGGGYTGPVVNNPLYLPVFISLSYQIDADDSGTTYNARNDSEFWDHWQNQCSAHFSSQRTDLYTWVDISGSGFFSAFVSQQYYGGWIRFTVDGTQYYFYYPDTDSETRTCVGAFDVSPLDMQGTNYGGHYTYLHPAPTSQRARPLYVVEALLHGFPVLRFESQFKIETDAGGVSWGATGSYETDGLALYQLDN